MNQVTPDEFFWRLRTSRNAGRLNWRAPGQANIWLRRSNDDLEQFARVASHDLKSHSGTAATFVSFWNGNTRTSWVMMLASTSVSLPAA